MICYVQWRVANEVLGAHSHEVARFSILVGVVVLVLGETNPYLLAGKTVEPDLMGLALDIFVCVIASIHTAVHIAPVGGHDLGGRRRYRAETR